MQEIAKATAYTADGFRYFNVGLQGMIVFGRTMESGVLNAFADLDRGIASVINSIIHTLTGPLASALGAFGGISSKAKEMADNLNSLHIVPMPSLQNWASDAGLALEKAQTKLYDLVHQSMPSKNIDAWFANLQKSATASAKVIAEQALKLRTVAPPPEAVYGDPKALQKQLDELKVAMRSQEEVLADSYAKRAIIVGNSLLPHVISESTAHKC